MTDFAPDDAARPNFQLLSEEQIETIHQATLQLLETCGVRVAHPEALELLYQAGCPVQGDDRVLIPGWLVEQCIRSSLCRGRLPHGWQRSPQKRKPGWRACSSWHKKGPLRSAIKHVVPNL